MPVLARPWQVLALLDVVQVGLRVWRPLCMWCWVCVVLLEYDCLEPTSLAGSGFGVRHFLGCCLCYGGAQQWACNVLGAVFFRANGWHNNVRRRQWSEEANCHLSKMPPGGWSAKGQPCEAFYMYFRSLVDSYIDSVLGYLPCIVDRPDLSLLPRNSSGVVDRAVTAKTIIDANIWAWDHMPANLYRWAWVSRGLVTPEELAEASGIPVESITKSLDEAEKQQHEFYLTEVPSLRIQ